MTKWVLPLVMGAASVGVVVFLANRELMAASQYAAIGGFLVTFATFGRNLWREWRGADAEKPEGPRPAPSTRTSWTIGGTGNNVIVKPKKKVNIHTAYGPDPDRKPDR
ncbi:hypothetical protein [Micromonospora robiginosa]|uniref:Uncharacterized protein n=1 Tax=Micromonospora robiginosa TaxID=2749844 RepID=A0A7L6B940_9ACTN|nr:hypothetical protein [Micromonospora ferruginea]QLQ38474.1 hypothetical protein H1D33_06390 [Micromonospora ferruginea]